METQQQQQFVQYPYQYQTQNDTNTTSVAPTSYDSYLHVQPYDQQSTQPYYAFPYNQTQQTQQQQQQQQEYASYYYPDYSSSYQNVTTTHQPQNDPHSIHPPGVPVSSDSQQTHVQNTQNYYYPHAHGVVPPQVPPSQGYMAPGHSTYMGGRGRGAFGSRGRGRGRGRGNHGPPRTLGSSAPLAADGQTAQSTTGKPPQPLAWCELCRVDCNTLEILEQHKNGKKHKRNVQVCEELQNLSKQLTVQNPQMPPSQPNQAVSSIAVAAPEKNEASSGVLPSGDHSSRNNQVGGRGGFKRKLKGGQGGKLMRAHDGSRRPVQPRKPKQVVPLLCDLCNVKCESQVVFQSHIAGKKHLSNVKRFQDHKEVFGEAIKDLYPTIANLPSTSIVPQTNQTGPPQDAEALASVILGQHQQSLQDPQAAHAALTQLLHQHGIHDAKTLLTQLVPYLIAPSHLPGTYPISAAGLGVGALNGQSQGAQLPTPENGTEQQNLTSNVSAIAGSGTNKPDDGQSSQTNSVAAEKVIPVPAKDKATASEHDTKT